MNDRTPEQKERAALLLELHKAVHISQQYEQAGQASGAVWLHFTDWYGFLDLPQLEELHLLSLSEYQFYRSVGDWRDDFPPSAYQLSPQAHLMLEYPARWIIDGEFTKQQKDDVLAKLKAQLEAMPMYSKRLPPFGDEGMRG